MGPTFAAPALTLLPPSPFFLSCRSDSSFNFFVFFFIFFVQDVLFVLQAIGIPGWGFRSVKLPSTLSLSLIPPDQVSPGYWGRGCSGGGGVVFYAWEVLASRGRRDLLPG